MTLTASLTSQGVNNITTTGYEFKSNTKMQQMGSNTSLKLVTGQWGAFEFEELSGEHEGLMICNSKRRPDIS